MRGFGRTIAAVTAGFVAANVIGKGFAQISGFIGGSVAAAKDLGESVNAVNQIFGTSAKEIHEWGNANASAFGLSRREFNQLATPMGAILKNLGFSQDEVATSTINLTKRAADMASVFNTDVGTALAAINSALRGESNPIEQFGVSVNQTAVNLRAMADSGKESADALTENEKAAARLKIIFEQTSAVSGDFANTSGELANATRISAAKTEELQAKLGEKLIPVMLRVTELKLKLTEALVAHLLPAMDRFSAWFTLHREEIEGALTDIGKAAAGFTGEFILGLQTLQPVVAKLFNFIVDNKVVMIAAITAIGVAIAIALGPASIATGAMVGMITLIGLFKDAWPDLEKQVTKSVNSVISDINELIRAYNKVPLLPNIGQIKPVGASRGGSQDIPLPPGWNDGSQDVPLPPGWLELVTSDLVHLDEAVTEVGEAAKAAAESTWQMTLRLMQMAAEQKALNGIMSIEPGDLADLVKSWNEGSPSAAANIAQLGDRVSIGTVPAPPQLAGGGFIERTGLAVVHKGETVSSGGGGITVNLNVTGTVVAERDLKDSVVRAVLEAQRLGQL